MKLDTEKRLLYSSVLSLIGDNFTNIALATVLYVTTKSPTAVASLFIFKAFAIFVSGFVVPTTIGYFKSKKALVIWIDILSALLIFILVFTNKTWVIYTVAFLKAFLNGFYHPTKQSGVQATVPKENRVSFISITQSATNLAYVIVPSVAGFVLSYIIPEIFFIIDGITFLMAASLLSKIPEWGTKETVNQKEIMREAFLEKLLKGYKIIFTNPAQRNLLYFRLILLFALSSYDVVVASVLTNFAKQLDYYNLPQFINFSFLLGIVSSVGAGAIILSSLYMKNRYSSDNLKIPFLRGVQFLAIGFLLWAIPVSLSFSWIFYLIGSAVLSAGLGFARVGVHTAGLELTKEEVYVEVVSSADALSRLWQGTISSVMVGMISLFPIPYIVIIGSTIVWMGIFPSNKILTLMSRRLTNNSGPS